LPGIAVTDGGFGSFFLTDPEAFPEAVEGETWGDEQQLLDLPGGPFRITGLSTSQAELMDREYSPIANTDLPSIEDLHETTVLRASSELFRGFELEGWTYTLDEDPAPDRLRVAALQWMALVPWMSSMTAGLWTSLEDVLFQGVIENYLRVIVAHRLLLGDGLLLHSAGVVIDESAYLFIGASGAGKSTLAGKALEAGAPVLSDDLNAIVNLSGELSVSQLPFTGELRDQATFDGTVPLRGIFVLEKGEEIDCGSISRGERVAAIVATAPSVNHGTHNLNLLLAVATALTDRVPVARLISTRASTFEEIKGVVQRFHEER
jgi:hypothetical protein